MTLARMRPVISGTIAALVLVASTTAAAHADDAAPPPPKAELVDVGTTSIPAVSDAVARTAEEADDNAADLVAQLPARRTDDFGLVGVTWTRGFDAKGMTVQVRLHTDGAWSPWEELDLESDPAEGGRDGTEPLWAGSADGVAVRVTSPTGQRPGGLSVATIDPGTNPAAQTSSSAARTTPHQETGAVTQADGSPAYTPKPAIISRSSWGARKNTYCDSPRTGNETRGIVVHHSAGTNSHSRSQSAGIVRAVQAYHMKSRDWCDIGYNFLVDKYGQIFEGRNGGVDKPVRGAHAGTEASNTYTMGVAMMGTFSSAQPSAALKDAMVKLLGWRLGTTFHAATGTYSIGSLKLERIAGHRNVVSTACPGAAAYAWLSANGGLRDRVAAYLASYSSPIKTRVLATGLSHLGPVYVGEASLGGGRRKINLKYGDMYSSGSETQYVNGTILVEYRAHGSEKGVLGAPSGDPVTLAANLVTQEFGAGTIYWISRSGRPKTYAIWGAVDAKYRQLGATRSRIGTPIRGLTSLTGGRLRATFTHGTITRNANGSVTVAYG